MPDTPHAGKIPEEEQRPMRRRLKIMRESTGLFLYSVPGISSGTLSKYELHDISVATLASLRALALAYGMEMAEFIKYLIGENEHIGENRALIRSMNYLRSMDPERQKVASEILQSLAEYSRNGEKD